MSAVETIRLAEHSHARRVAQVFEQHGRLARLCDELEGIADSLPRACPKRCGLTAIELQTLVPNHHAFEAEVLSDLLSAEQGDLLRRIIDQHAEDEGLAFEIALALEPIGEGATAEQPETLGYMLRCFFNSCRRSMLVEELALRAVTPAANDYAAPYAGARRER